MNTNAAIARYRELHAIILRSVMDVTFPFGVVAPVRREMDMLTERYGVDRCSDCNAIEVMSSHQCAAR